MLWEGKWMMFISHFCEYRHVKSIDVEFYFFVYLGLLNCTALKRLYTELKRTFQSSIHSLYISSGYALQSKDSHTWIPYINSALNWFQDQYSI